MDVVKTVGWLEESISCQPNIKQNLLPLQPNKQWIKDINRQNENKLNNVNEDEAEIGQPLHIPSTSVPIAIDNQVGFSVEQCDDKDLDEVAHAICVEYSLNRKQKSPLNSL